MKSRSERLEILDGPEVTQDQIRKSLDFMVGVNRYLGGSRAVTDYFESHAVPESFTVADLGSGGGDIPYALVGWARKHGKKISIVGFDTNPYCITYARKRFSLPEIQYVQKSAFEFEKVGPFDYVMSSMFFHHLKDQEIISLLKKMKENTRRGFIVNDLYRGYLPCLGVALLGLVSLNYMAIHDGSISVTRGFKEKDGLLYRKESGIDKLQIKRKPVYRFTLSYHV